MNLEPMILIVTAVLTLLVGLAIGYFVSRTQAEKARGIQQGKRSCRTPANRRARSNFRRGTMP